MDAKLESLLAKLQLWHWSPEFPTTYVLPNGAGLGKVAMSNPGAFNLTWQRFHGDFGDHMLPVHYFSKVGTALNSTHLHSAPLADYATLLSRTEFELMYLGAKHNFNSKTRLILDEAFSANV